MDLSGAESQSQSPMASPFASPVTSPRRRRRSSITPAPDAALINLPDPNRGTPRRGSQAFLMADDTIVMQFEGGKRRMSSFCTTSSNEDTIMTIDENMTEEEVMETLRAHKQIIANVKTQTWPMHRKLKVLRKAKAYIKKHEGELKQSKQAKDIMAKYKAYMEKTIKKTKREIASLIVQMTPWEMRIKKIESQFGSVVASYFTFLRWVFWINTFISIFICAFLMVPEVLRGVDDPTGMRKEVESEESALTLQAIWDFEGYLKYSPIFYGYYSSEETNGIGYRLPLAYFLTCVILYLFSFYCIVRKMAQGARMSRTGSENDEYVFSWKVFTGWDYLIGNSETAYNKVASIVMGMKEVILEENERKKEEKKDWKMITVRVLANFFVLFLLGTSAYAVVLVVERSADMPESAGWVRENELTLVVSGIGIVYPNIFNMIGVAEAYHPGVALKWQLARILVLNLLNLYTLMFSLFGKVDVMTAALVEFKYNITQDKRIRMMWEAEATVTVMTERAERVVRSLDDEIEGRYFQWRGIDTKDVKEDQSTETIPSLGGSSSSSSFPGYSFPSSQTPSRSGSRTPSGSSSTFSFSPTSNSLPPLLHHGSFVIKDDWDQNNNGDPDDHDGLMEGRYEIPIYTRSTNRPRTTKVTDIFPDSTSTNPETGTEFPIDTTLATDSTVAVDLSTRATKRWRDRSTSAPSTSATSSYAESFTTSVQFTTSSTYEADIMTSTSPASDTKMCQNEPEPELIVEDGDLLLMADKDKETMRSLCWETMFGQELTKLTVMDLVLTIVSTIIGDFFRAVIVRYLNGKACFFWDLEKKWPGYSDFPIAENILHLVNNQGMVWLGMFFSPGLPVINTMKLCVMMYLRSWAVLTCNIPHETVFKASGNNFYYALLLLMLFICCLPVAYTCVWLAPSWHCGPFSEYERVYHIMTKYIESKLPKTLNKVVDYLTSPGSIVPLLLLLMLVIYYQFSTLQGLKEANADLKSQLKKEKDILNPEMAKTDPQNGAATATATPAGGSATPSGAPAAPSLTNLTMEKKHVRINEDVGSSSDKKPLLDKS